MIKSIKIENFGGIGNVEHDALSNLNVIIGPNQSGKTTLLKALYAAVKTVEQNKRGAENRSDKEILSDKLYWTFLTHELSSLVKKGTNTLFYKMTSNNGEEFDFSFTASAAKQANIIKNTYKPSDTNSIFIPAKEILSIRDVIISSRMRTEYGYDDTYYDLAMALTPTTRGRNYEAFAQARQSIESMVNGKLDFDRDRNQWIFQDVKKRIYEVSMTSEGVKKLSILSVLLGNHYLSDESIIFIDEVEANLHPAMINTFMNVVLMLSKIGVQFFIASHSYFVIKRLYILAHKEKMSIPVFSFMDEGCTYGDLMNNMPKNAIIDESVNLYKEEVML